MVSKENSYQNNATVNIHTLPYMLPEDDTNMTATSCISRCQLYGYNAAGIEVGTQCCKWFSFPHGVIRLTFPSLW